MPKLKYLDATQSLSVAQNGFSNLLRDIHRNDPVAKTLCYFSVGDFDTVFQSNSENPNAMDAYFASGGSTTANNIIGVAEIATLVAETNDVLAMHYVKVGSGYKIGRVEGETDSNLLAETAFGVPERTTFPSIQSFVEKCLTNQSMRTLLEATTGAWDPTGTLDAIAIKQSSQQIFGIFSASAQVGSTQTLAIVDMDDISDIHFGE